MQWVEIPHGRKTKGATFVAVSDTGMLLRKNGEIVPSTYRQCVSGNRRIYRIIADNFLVTVRRPDQVQIDHITHKPGGMNINDVRNMRWCTQKENRNFPEAIENNSKSHKGKAPWNSGLSGTEYTRHFRSESVWNKGLTGLDYVKHYKDGVKNQYTKGE